MKCSLAEGCPKCGLCFTYPIIMVDDLNVIRTIGEPLDRCWCGLCTSCHGECRVDAGKNYVKFPEIQVPAYPVAVAQFDAPPNF